MAKILKTIATATILIALLSSCGQAATTDLPKTDQPPNGNSEPAGDVITDLSGPIWIGKSFKLFDATWTFSNYRAMEKIGETTASKEMFHVVDVDIDATAPMNLDSIRFEMVDVFGNRFLPTENENLYANLDDRISYKVVNTMSSSIDSKEPITFKAAIVFEGLKKTQGLSIEILDKTATPEKRLALIDMGI